MPRIKVSQVCGFVFFMGKPEMLSAWFINGQSGQRPGDMPRISHEICGWGGKASGSIFFRWHNHKITVAFLNEYRVFTLLALSHSAQIVIKALRAWHLGHPPHDFCVVPLQRERPVTALRSRFAVFEALGAEMPVLRAMVLCATVACKRYKPSSKWQQPLS